MLYELRVENLLLMERAELRLVEGLNMLTGETGAGKTLLAHALDLLLGGKARRGIVRPGAREAYVEGVFALPAELAGSERLPAGVQEIVLGRRVWPDGRTRAYVCGRAATVADLQELGGRLLAFYGQHEHRKLMLQTAQLDVLDAYCGSDALAARAELRVAHDRTREVEHRADELRVLAGARERELDLVSFELDEIDAAAPSAEEETALVAERDRLRHLETLQGAAAAGADAIAPESGPGISELLARAVSELERATEIDPELRGLAERLAGLRYEAEDIGSELRVYSDGLTEQGAGRERLQAVEERLAIFARLERKHGGDIAAVLAHGERCRERQAELENADQALAAAEVQLADVRSGRDAIAERIGALRRAAAPRLADAVRERLAELAMAEARFEVTLTHRDGGCGPRGADAIEMRIAANPGSPLGPLREVASGGELSRLMLALLSVAHDKPATEAQAGALLVFDEVDAGIGGHTARAVGEHLRALSAGRQVLCITHLPQVAALAQRHFTIAKDTRRDPATTTVTTLDGDQVVGELVRMLGAAEQDSAASEHARELLRAA